MGGKRLSGSAKISGWLSRELGAVGVDSGRITRLTQVTRLPWVALVASKRVSEPDTINDSTDAVFETS